MILEESVYDCVGLRRMMSPERGGDPLFREEDVSRPLDVPERLQGRPDVSEGFLLPEGMVQILEGGLGPGLMPPVLRKEKCGEYAVADRPVLRDGGGDEIELPQAVGIVDASPLRVQDFRAAFRETDGEFQGKGRVIGFIQFHARPGGLVFPDPVHFFRKRIPLEEPREGTEGGGLDLAQRLVTGQSGKDGFDFRGQGDVAVPCQSAQVIQRRGGQDLLRLGRDESFEETGVPAGFDSPVQIILMEVREDGYPLQRLSKFPDVCHHVIQ